MQPTVSARKRDAIARAALTLFARDGYERTSVDAIAAEAQVSKRTVYSHYGDKENLFLLVVNDTYQQFRERFAEVSGRMARDVHSVDEVEKSLTECVGEIVRAISSTPDRALLVRLVMTEMPRFPALLELWRNRSIVPLLADPLARLTAAGLLAAGPPTLAAEHLSALTFGQINSRSMMGTIALSDAETDRIISSGIRVWLCAYGVPRSQSERR